MVDQTKNESRLIANKQGSVVGSQLNLIGVATRSSQSRQRAPRHPRSPTTHSRS